MANDHRGRPLHAGKRTRDPQVEAMLNRKPTVPSVISRQGIAETARRARYAASGAVIGGISGTFMTADSMYSGTVGEWLSPERLSTGVTGGAIGAAIGAVGVHKIMKEDD